MSSIATDARPPSFRELYRRGMILADAIDDFVARWHDGADVWASNLPLHEYLGLSRAEYEAWVRDGANLPDILSAP